MVPENNSQSLQYPAELPVTAMREEIVQAIRQNQVVIVAGETGSGKSTQLPKMCLEAGRGMKGLIGCTQPRRIAAVSLATRVAEELQENCGQRIGYKIRFHGKVSKTTVIKYMTDGVLLAESQGDRNLRSYDTILIDEAHERSLNIDFLLGILQRLLAKRQDLRVIITSATLDIDKFTTCFPAAPVIEVAGRTFPVELRYLDNLEKDSGEASHIDKAAEAVLNIRRQDRKGDVLIFMPTERDIIETKELIQAKLKDDKGKDALILPLFGRMARREQQRIFAPASVQKIVIATNIAETSLTVPGIRYVIDSGLARTTMYNPRARTTKMPVMAISQASADQRKGRCGRVGPGICIRLFPEDDYLGRTQYTTPEILRSNLAEVILRMLALRLGDPYKFPFPDPPSRRAIRDGYLLLTELKAIDKNGKLTGDGRIMSRLPLDPRVSRMILSAKAENALREVSVIAAALSIQDPRIRKTGQEKEADAAHALYCDATSDFLSLFNLWEAYHRVIKNTGSRSKARKYCRQNFLSYQRMREWEDIHGQIVGLLKNEKGFTYNQIPAKPENTHRAILTGNLRFIGLRKSKNIYQGGQGKEVMLFPGSVQFNRGGEWIMASEFMETSKLFARTVATIKPQWLEPLAGDLCRSSYHSPHWEKKRGQVVAFENVTLFGLTIVSKRRINFGLIDPEQARDIFIQTALLDGELVGDFGFYQHNFELLARLEDMEDRLRQRDILVNSSTLHQFYDERLPADVFDRASLKRFVSRKADDFLKMTEEDVVLALPDEEELLQFPEKLTMNGMSYDLSYTFKPGGEKDGVSVHIPVGHLSDLHSERFEWLVPGLLEEKITVLLRGLPKKIRRELVPLPQTAKDIMQEISFGHGSLYKAIISAVEKNNRVRIDPKAWTNIDLPDHLRMGYVLKNKKGEFTAKTKVFDELLAEKTATTKTTVDYGALKKKWQRGGITHWDFKGLSEVIPFHDKSGRLIGNCYPVLVQDGPSAVRIKICTSESEKQQHTPCGLAFLYGLQFGKQLKQVKKDFSLKKVNWAFLDGLGSPADLDDHLLCRILTNIFDLNTPDIPDEETFLNEVARVRSHGFYQLAKEIFDLVVKALEARLETITCIRKLIENRGPGDRCAFFMGLVDQIVPPDFLEFFNKERLSMMPRYLKALRIRVERATNSPAKDDLKEKQVAIHAERMAGVLHYSVMTGELGRLADEYCRMIDEFRISLFAQEMKTIMPVSAQRLEKKWQELEHHLVMEEGSPEKKNSKNRKMS